MVLLQAWYKYTTYRIPPTIIITIIIIITLPQGLSAFGKEGVWLPFKPKNSLDFKRTTSVAFSFGIPVKPRRSKMWEWNGKHCSNAEQKRNKWHIIVVPGRKKQETVDRVRNWCRGRRFGQFGPLLLWTSSIHQRAFQRKSLSLGGWSFPSTQKGCYFWSIGCSRG